MKTKWALVAFLLCLSFSAQCADFQRSMMGNGVFYRCTTVAAALGDAMDGYQYGVTGDNLESLAKLSLDTYKTGKLTKHQKRVFETYMQKIDSSEIYKDKSRRETASVLFATSALSSCAHVSAHIPEMLSDATKKVKACDIRGSLYQSVMMHYQMSGVQKTKRFFRKKLKHRDFVVAMRALRQSMTFPIQKDWTDKAFDSYWFAYTATFLCIDQINRGN